MYYIEKTLLIAEGLTCLIAIWFIPRKKVDKASFIFLMTQFFTWILGLCAVEFGGLEYPFHLLSKANSTSFIFEYFALPIFAVLFILYYPTNKPLVFRVSYYVGIISAFTAGEYFVEKYTMILKYLTWRWYWTWISMFLVIYFVMVIYKWFFKIKKVFSL